MIEVKNLTKVYSNGKGIFDVTFSVEKGEVFGFLGPNGAGKTTTIRQLLGFMNANSGICTINGFDCRTEAQTIQKSLGYIPGEISFMNEMNGGDFLSFMHDMRGMKDRHRCDELIVRLGLETHRKIKKMSKGMKQKLGIITAFMHDPDVYILDEPTSGLDPLMQSVFVELVQEEKARGKTFLMSSHMFEEIAKTCDRAGIIKDGKLVAIEDIHSLQASQSKTFIVTVSSEKDKYIIKESGLIIEEINGFNVYVTVSNDYKLFTTTIAHCDVLSIDVVTSDLEQIFMKYYEQGSE